MLFGFCSGYFFLFIAEGLKNIEANRIQNTAATITIIHRPESVIHLFPHRFSSAKSLEINEINDAFAFYFSQKQA